VGLRAKMYCYAIEHKDFTELKKRGKGIVGHIINRYQLLKWKQVLDREVTTYATFKMIKSENSMFTP
jgi:hypothetical protein